MVFEDPTGSFLVVGPRAARTCQLARAGVSSVDLWSTFSNVGWALVSTFSGFQVDPESISVSAPSVKVVGVIRPVHNHTVSPLLAFFFSFHDPNTLRTVVLLQPWNGWQAYAVPPYALLCTFLL